MTKINICFPFVGNDIGGSSLSALEIINALDKKKFMIHLAIHNKGQFYQLLKSKNMNINFLPIKTFVGQKKGLLRNFIILIKNFFKIYFYIKKNNINFVHSNDGSIHLTWVVPTIFTKSKFFWHQRNKFPNWPLYKIFSIFSYKIICISNFVFSSLPKFLKKKTIVIYDKVSLVKNNTDTNEKIFFNKIKKINKKKRILFFANIIDTKKINIFLKSAFYIFKKDENCFFLIIGSDKFGIFEKLFKKINNKKFKKKIFYQKRINNVKKLFDNSNALISTSVNEGLNRSIIEAMLCNLPVIASNSGGHKEIIINSKTGWLVEANNYKKFSKQTLKLFSMKKEQISYLTNNAKRHAETFFSSTKLKEKLENLYIKNT